MATKTRVKNDVDELKIDTLGDLEYQFVTTSVPDRVGYAIPGQVGIPLDRYVPLAWHFT
jgi:hypothetical protein